MVNQKGLSTVILILTIVILGAAIVGGSYLYKTQYMDKRDVQKTEINEASPSPASKLSIKGKVLFVSKTGNLSVADPDGKNILPVSSDKLFKMVENGLPPRVIGISPDSSKFILAAHVKYDPANPEDPDYKIGNMSAYYISSVDGKNLQKIDLTKFSKLGTSMIILNGWSTDGNKIIFTGIIPQPSGPAKTMYGDYDPVSEEIRPIYTADSPQAGYLMYYDSQKGTVIFSSQLPGSADPTGKLYKLNLQTKNIEEFNRPTLNPGNIGMNVYIPYFVTSDSDFSSKERRAIKIYSYDQPNIPIAEIKLNNPQSNFTNNYVWSPNYNYLAISSGYSEEKDGKLEFYRKLNIYTREGKPILSREINNFEYYSGSLFSPDESNLLMVGITTLKDGPKMDIPIWQVIDIKSGEQLSEKVISEDLGLNTVEWLR